MHTLCRNNRPLPIIAEPTLLVVIGNQRHLRQNLTRGSVQKIQDQKIAACGSSYRVLDDLM